MSNWMKWSMYVMSYLPLYILILLQNMTDFSDMIKKIIWCKYSFNDNLLEFCVFIFILILVFWALLTWEHIYSNKVSRNTKIGTYEDAGEGTLNYLATFIVPLISLKINDGNTMIANLFLFILLGQLYTMGDLLYLNPVFTIFGFHILRDKDTKKVMLSRYSISQLHEAGQSNLNYINVSILGASEINIIKKIVNNEYIEDE
ncbi:hypothetical protein [Leuconostoc mesenteroides]|uniref:hypothetical protein n=1 Tax=Leuconostoc mesenteroides TaxID=1245 RepID=UPI000DFEFBC9|nr:hypothetical protein [Leuconostoc mesenteroides]STY39360.1 Uncharacterised protein [Leuconostoc mesenteroides]